VAVITPLKASDFVIEVST